MKSAEGRVGRLSKPDTGIKCGQVQSLFTAPVRARVYQSGRIPQSNCVAIYGNAE